MLGDTNYRTGNVRTEPIGSYAPALNVYKNSNDSEGILNYTTLSFSSPTAKQEKFCPVFSNYSHIPLHSSMMDGGGESCPLVQSSLQTVIGTEMFPL